LEWLTFQIADRIIDENSINDFKMNQNLTIPLQGREGFLLDLGLIYLLFGFLWVLLIWWPLEIYGYNLFFFFFVA
jgi:hypothetical protein